MMKVNKLIKSRREQLGWDDMYMPRRVGLSWSEYYDIEAYEDELKDVTPLMYVRRIAEAIDVPIYELFGLEARDDAPLHWRRELYLAEARQKLGATVSEMSDGIGFEESFVQDLEVHSNFLELYPYEVLKMVAEYLKVPPFHLFGKLRTDAAVSTGFHDGRRQQIYRGATAGTGLDGGHHGAAGRPLHLQVKRYRVARGRACDRHAVDARAAAQRGDQRAMRAPYRNGGVSAWAPGTRPGITGEYEAPPTRFAARV